METKRRRYEICRNRNLNILFIFILSIGVYVFMTINFKCELLLHQSSILDGADKNELNYKETNLSALELARLKKMEILLKLK